MPFVKRDNDGNIEAIFASPENGATEEVSGSEPDVRQFLGISDVGGDGIEDWIKADLSLARVTEDLIDLLIEKGVISFTELPEAAQGKLISRRGLRNELSYVVSLFGSDEDGVL
jgi:hypothetical protein